MMKTYNIDLKSQLIQKILEHPISYLAILSMVLSKLFLFIYLQYVKRVKTHLAIWLFYHVTLCKTVISIQSTYIHVQDKNMHKNKTVSQ